MKEEYIFPENKWYLKIDDDNRDLVNNWRINIIKYSNTTCNYPYILWNGSGCAYGPPNWVFNNYRAI